MNKKKGNTVKFETLVKAFMEQCDIPTKSDIDRLVEKIENLENMMSRPESTKSAQAAAPRMVRGPGKPMTASGQVLEVVKGFKQGVDFARLQNKTGFEDKKLRNIIFRLNKIGKIQRKSRGLYVTS